jgi:phenylacetate-CoA ligase
MKLSNGLLFIKKWEVRGMQYRLKINDQCNNNCFFCNLLECKSRHSKSIKDIRKEIEMAVTKAKDIVVCGGEPTIRKDLISILNLINNHRGNIILETNARLFFYESFVKKMKSFDIKEVRVLVYGNTDDIHDKISGVKGSFEQTLNGIRNLKMHGFDVSIKVIVNDRNYKISPDIVKYFLKMDIKDIDFFLPHEIEIRKLHFPRMIDVLDELIASHKVAKKSGINLKINDNEVFLEYILNYYHILKYGKPLFFRVDLHPIWGCNSQCIICDNWKNRKGTTFNKKKAVSLLRDMKRFGVTEVRFHGQEPTIFKDLIPLISEAKNLGFQVGLKTNCNLLNEDYVNKLYSSGLDTLYVSIDSQVSEIHNKIRGHPRSFENNLKTIKLLRRKPRHIRILSNTVVTNLNYKGLDKMLDLAKTHGIDNVCFVQLNAKNKKNVDKLKLSKEQMSDFFFKEVPKVIRKSIEFNIPVNLSPFFKDLVNKPMSEVLWKLENQPDRFQKEINEFSRGNYGKAFYKEYGCLGFFDHATIDPDGNIYSCCVMPRSEKLAKGNVHKQGIEDIWKSKEYKSLRGSRECRHYFECGSNLDSRKALFDFINKQPVVADIRNAWDYFEYLNSLYRLPRSMLGNIQWMRFKDIITFAYLNIPFYEKKFKQAGTTPMDIEERSDIAKIPVTTRKEIRDNFPHNLIAKKKKSQDIIIEQTSGSMKDSIEFAKEWGYREFVRNAFSFSNISGWKWGDPYAILTTLHCSGSCSKERNKPDYVKEIILPTKHGIMDDPQGMRERAKIIGKSKPKIIHADPNYLKALAIFLNRNKMNIPNPLAISSTYELLTESTKKYLESAFQCKVFDQYGCSEIGPVANSCRKGNKHVFMDSVFLEVEQESKSATHKRKGKIVLTNLDNYAMPLIRYDVGDMGTLSDRTCSCGMNTKILESIDGRADEFITSSKGKKLGLNDFDKILAGINGIDFFQIIHEAGLNNITVNLIKNDKWSDSSVKGIRKRLQFNIDENLKVDLSFVKTIRPEASGKFKFVRSGDI